MNPNQPSREQIEARITALLLGELPADEAQLLRWAIAQDAALQKLQGELASTIVLVREAEKNPAAASGENISLKLSDERRKKLLAHFQTPRPQPKNPLFWLKPTPFPKVPRLIEVLAAVAIIALLAAMLLPSLASAKKKAQRVTALNGLRMQELQARMESAAAPAATPAPVVVPSAEIFLPKPDSTPEVAQNEALAASAPPDGSTIAAPTISKSPAPAAPQASASGTFALSSGGVVEDNLATQTHTLDSTGDLRDEKSRYIQNNGTVFGVVNAFAGAGGVRGGAGGGGVALNYQAGASAISPAAGLPAGNISGVIGNGLAAGDASQSQPLAKRLITANDGWSSDGDVVAAQNQVAAQERFYRSTINGSDANKTPVMGDLPASANLFGLNRHAVNAPAVTTAPVPADAPATADFGSFDGSIRSPVVTSEAAKELPKSGSGTLALNGNNNYSGVTAVSGGTLVTDDFETAGTSRAASDQSHGFNLDSLKRSGTQPENRDQNGFAFDSGNGVLQSPVEVAQNSTFQQRLQSNVSRASGSVQADKDQRVAGISEGERSSANVILAPSAVQTTNAIAMNDGAVGSPDGISGGGGLHYTTQTTLAASQSKEARDFIGSLGVNLQSPPGKVVFYNDRVDKLFVVATDQDLDVIEKAIAPLTVSSVDSKQETLSKAGANDLRMKEFNLKTGAKLPATMPVAIDNPVPKAPQPVPVPQPEILTRENAFSTFSLNVSDVSFKLAAASLENGRLPDAASIRSEEFINAFDYRDPAAAAGQPVAFTSERARYPFAQNRDLLRFSIKTAAAGRAADRPLNLVLLLDKSGSMERADRVAIIREAMRVLATQLHPQDTVSVVTFARTARLWADGVSGDKAGETLSQVGGITPEGGTNLEEAMRLAYETARRHYLANGINRVVLLTDGAANLGNVDAAVLKQKVETQRKQGIALDCFGIGWEDFNDDMLAELSGNGDGRYAFINTPEEAGTEFAAKLAGALQVAAQDVKVQVEFNPQRVTSWRQIGYAKHQLTKEQFRDNTVLAAEIAAQEAGNALYTVETIPDGVGPVATVYVRYKIPGTEDVQEHSWEVPYAGNAPALEQSSAAMRLAATASAFSEWLAASPFAQEVSPDDLLKVLSGVPEIYGADQRPKKLEWMIRQAKSLSGK